LVTNEFEPQSVSNSRRLLVMTAQTMSFRYELAYKRFNSEKAQHITTAKLSQLL